MFTPTHISIEQLHDYYGLPKATGSTSTHIHALAGTRLARGLMCTALRSFRSSAPLLLRTSLCGATLRPTMFATTRSPPPGSTIVTEGKASIIFPSGNQVFYNNVQEFNRDISILVIRMFSEMRQQDNVKRSKSPRQGIRILEALAATGLRSVRYFKEIPGVQSITVNDIEPAAVEAIKRNIEFNDLPSGRLQERPEDV